MDPGLERTLKLEIERLLGGSLEGARLTRLGRALSSLHARFISEDAPSTAAAPYLADRDSLAAYLAYFFPASMAQASRVVREVSPPNSASLRVLDVGAGPGPAGMAVASWLRAHGRKVSLTAIDVSSDALKIVERLWPSGWGTCATRTWSAGATLPDGPFDVIVASHSINELFSQDTDRIERRAALVMELSSRLSSDGLLVLVEPALRRTGRELLEVRDRVLSKGLHVVAPCLMEAACPALEKPKDWCHADRPWSAPAMVDQAARSAGLARESLKYSYLVLTRQPLADARPSNLFRIVSEPLGEKGKLRFFGCGLEGRVPLVRLDRERSDSNAAFSALERGDVVSIDELGTAGDGRRVMAASPVKVVVSAVRLDRADA